MLNTNSGASLLTPTQVAELVVLPLVANSIAGQALTPVATESHQYRIPRVAQDPAAAWVAEGDEIPVSDAAIDEIIVTPRKLAGLSVISQELADDSSPAAVDTIGNGIVRDLSRKLDAALFSDAGANGPSGLATLSGISTVSAGAAYASLDAFSDALYSAASNNGTLGAWVTHPETAKILSKLKEGATSNRALLQPDPTRPGASQIGGVRLLTCTAIPTAGGVVWGLPTSQSYLVMRKAAEIESDRSVFFTSHRVAVRSIVRAGFGFPNPAAVVKISTTTGS